MGSVLHLTHTDLRFDSRIRKEIFSLLGLPNIQIYAFGVFSDERADQDSTFSSFPNTVDFNQIHINNPFVRRLPSIITHPFKLLFLTCIFFSCIEGVSLK